MKWYWYVARDDELMMDCDGRALLEIAIKRLERSRDRIGPHQIFTTHSNSPDHFHLVVRLGRRMEVLERQVWQLFFMDHVYRSVKNLFRVIEGVPCPSLLISPERWLLSSEYNPPFPDDGYHPPTFWREPDATCRCKSHKDPKKIWKCPAHKKLRGANPKEGIMLTPQELSRRGPG